MKQDIPVVVIGLEHRRGISVIPPIFGNTLYYVASCMDLTEVEEYRYSPHNLAVILHNLHPRPRALLIGIAVDPSYTCRACLERGCGQGFEAREERFERMAGKRLRLGYLFS
ncbi:uncharacterized protein BDZ83DRAFT_622935 [Colletotrichum acutatum]|uniref:Uncharacterized protein n=1 Tax=Glomerella acutata TaxID=27357 RepID=A0AAD8UM72_GLOAC|nr:uncharacterized protein BDZ83DRAFT_622935 [Colletotrichum acutatum]KAK1724520.1 hypothetical protein BDZ83DRAFT_622935 [Colletotrichum acutatum]